MSSRARPLEGVLGLVCAFTAGVILTQAAHAQTFTTTTSTTTGVTMVCPSDFHTETSVTTETTFGPATILIGEDQSQSFFVPAGTTNVNTNTHTQYFVCVATPVPTLGGWASGLLAMLLAMCGSIAWHVRHRAPGPRPPG